MADFDDITGWQEELEAYLAMDEGRAYFSGPPLLPGGVPSRPDPKVKISNMMECAELFLKHEELERVIDLYLEWEAIDESMSDVYDERHPDYDDKFEGIFKAMADFGRWYFMKTQIPFNSNFTTMGSSIAINVKKGKFPAVRSRETVDFLKGIFKDSVIDDWSCFNE